MPNRISHWLLNTLGAVCGAALALVLEKRGWLYHWAQFRQHCLVPDAGGSLVLMVLWPLALLFPMSVPLGLGQVLARLREASAQVMSNPEVVAKLGSQGLELRSIKSDELSSFGRAEIIKWADLVKRSGAQID